MGCSLQLCKYMIYSVTSKDHYVLFGTMDHVLKLAKRKRFIATLNISCSTVQFPIQTALHPVQQLLTYSKTGLKYLHKTMEKHF